jgi:6-phosphofructokinase 1
MKINGFEIPSLGKASHQSPLPLSSVEGDQLFNFVRESDRVVFNTSLQAYEQSLQSGEVPLSLEKAGPRKELFFKPGQTTAAIVTCGGLCPGINNVIRSLVMGLHYFYGAKKIIGIPYGYQGLAPDNPHPYQVGTMVDTLVSLGVDILFAIGGDGTLKGVEAIGKEIEKRGLQISAVGIPKTIDNDIDLIDKSFGFETAYSVASNIIRDAHNEARGAHNGIAIVKLMGRDSGFIAASASMSMPEVNFLLIPELSFGLEGQNGFLHFLEERLKSKQHAVIVVAEGAGQHLFDKESVVRDASGNIKHQDIGVFLKERISQYFVERKTEVTIKYIDPSYIIRSAPANASDSIFCNRLAYQAVHGAMSGKTRFVVGLMNNQLVYLPISAVVQKRKKISLEGEFWFAALQSTGQPFTMT